ncbi:MAG: hypothetical protein RSB37_00985 [Acetivibrio sp.]
MKPILSLWQEILGLVVWCAAVMVWFALFKNLQFGYGVLGERIFHENLIYEEKQEKRTEELVSKNELTGSLLIGISYDVEIDGELLKKETFNARYFDYSGLASWYEKTYHLEKESGQILKICYKRKETG